jgi:hypothetical protein
VKVKNKGFILFIVLVIFILSSFSVVAEDYSNYELGVVSYNDNTFEFDIKNVRDQPLDVKLNVVDTYNLVEVDFNEEIFELDAGEQKRIIMEFDLSANLKKSIDETQEYNFMIIPTIINRRDNSILILKDNTQNPIEPQSIMIRFNAEKKGFSFGFLTDFIELYLMNIVIYILLISFVIYFVYQITTMNKSKNKDYDYTPREKKKWNFKLPEIKLPKIKKKEKIPKRPEPPKEKPMAHIHTEIKGHHESHNIFTKEEESKPEPKTYKEIIREFVEKNNGVWTSAQFIKLLTILKKNDINKKINVIKDDLEEEKNRMLSISKTHSTVKETKKELNEIDDIKDRLKKIRDRL